MSLAAMPGESRSGKGPDVALQERSVIESALGDQFGTPDPTMDLEDCAENQRQKGCCQHCHGSLATIIDMLDAERSAAADREKRLQSRIDQLSLTVQELARGSLFSGEESAMKTAGKTKKSKKSKAKEGPSPTVSEVSEIKNSNGEPPNLDETPQTTPNANGPTVRDAPNTAAPASTSRTALISTLLSSFDDHTEAKEASWNLVTNKKPGPKKAVFYIGKLKQNETEEHLTEFVNRRAQEAGIETEVFECKVFNKENSDGEPARNVSARLMINDSSSDLITHWKFWPKPVYIRDWKFDDKNKPNGEQNEHGQGSRHDQQ